MASTEAGIVNLFDGVNIVMPALFGQVYLYDEYTLKLVEN